MHLNLFSSKSLPPDHNSKLEKIENASVADFAVKLFRLSLTRIL